MVSKYSKRIDARTSDANFHELVCTTIIPTIISKLR